MIVLQHSLVGNPFRNILISVVAYSYTQMHMAIQLEQEI